MTDLLLFVLGLLITIVTIAAVLLVGHAEAQDPSQNRTERPLDEP
jgi:hypothetical protein